MSDVETLRELTELLGRFIGEELPIYTWEKTLSIRLKSLEYRAEEE